jgi:poly-gamma-glutamate synthesis protein (capsule biosynthesis protein)
MIKMRHSIMMAALVLLTIILVCPLVSLSASEKGQSNAPIIKSNSVRLLFCGDLMPHKGVKRSAMEANRKGVNGKSLNYGGFYRTLRDLKSLTEQADVAFCNLETPVVKPPKGDPYCFTTRGDFFFKAPPVLVDAIKWAGFSVVSIANNHIDNAGTEGIISTIEFLKKKDIGVAGAGQTTALAHSPTIVEVNGVSIAYLAFCSSRLGSDPNCEDTEKVHVCRVDPRDSSTKILFEDISYAKSVADIVVLSFHWGPSEYQYSPSPSTIKLAKECAERGVSVIAGHHPHVLQKVEHYKCRDGRKSLIMWSLGNLVSNQSPQYGKGGVSKENLSSSDKAKEEDGARRREGAAVMVTLDNGVTFENKVSNSLPALSRSSKKPHYNVTNVSFAPLWTDNNYDSYTKGLEKADVRVISVDSEMKRLQNRILFLKERKKRVVLALQGKLEEYVRMQESAGIEESPEKQSQIIDTK